MNKHDFILIAVVVAVAALIWGYLFFAREDDADSMLVITADGEMYGQYDLSVDREITIGDTNRCVIKDGSVSMKWSDCANQVCVEHMAISQGGETIVCVPNRIILSIESDKGGDVDAVVR